MFRLASVAAAAFAGAFVLEGCGKSSSGSGGNGNHQVDSVQEAVKKIDKFTADMKKAAKTTGSNKKKIEACKKALGGVNCTGMQNATDQDKVDWNNAIIRNYAANWQCALNAGAATTHKMHAEMRKLQLQQQQLQQSSPYGFLTGLEFKFIG